MPKKITTNGRGAKISDSEQSKRFIQAAKNAGADESEMAFEKKMARLGKCKPSATKKDVS